MYNKNKEVLILVLTVDIGNTNITLGAFNENDIVWVSRLATQRNRTSEQYAIELKSVFELENDGKCDFEGAIISSVVPELTSSIQRAVKKITHCEPIILASGLKTGLKIAVGNPKEVGADLVAGAVGAIDAYELPCLVMDLGTATKITVIDEGGVFLGCTIAAGVRISLEALSQRTSQLPAIAFSAPPHVIGTNTPDCIKSGTVIGTAAMLDGMAERLEKELGKKVKTVVATGGYAREIVKCCYHPIVYDENLLLKGLLVIYNKNK